MLREVTGLNQGHTVDEYRRKHGLDLGKPEFESSSFRLPACDKFLTSLSFSALISKIGDNIYLHNS